MLNDAEIELVRRFHESDLSEEELIWVNQRIDTDADFKEEVERLGLVRDTIVQLVGHEQGLKAAPVLTKGEGQKESRNKWLLPLAACLLLLIGCFAYYQYTLSQANEQIFADCETFAYSISSDIMRSDSPDTNTAILNEADEAVLQSVMENYDNKNWDAAEKEALSLQNTSEDMTAQEIVAWWLVTIYLQKGEKEKAKHTLENITKHPDFNSKANALKIMNSL